ncbi:MAG: tRNA (adenosine(37)-N6)-dimethylallyltransferase MiaA [Defluviitaleaceae bacterium]|nr:tRNA (adenosine(37)-N6)-dimethylallyltransferase MiaA [Defluviitaleaceae bacterium]
MEKIYVIAGPTASGKTAVAIALAKEIGGEVVSADSMQVYKGMDIGTAKPSMAEREGIPHHMIDVVAPDVAYSAALYQQQARAAISDVQSRGYPILCGGTGFYINGVLRDIDFAKDTDPYSEIYENLAAAEGSAHLHSMLQQVDPVAAEAIHPNNVKRVIRALSYNRETGELFSLYNETQKKQSDVYQAVVCVLSMERSILYERINQRVEAMFDAGLEKEVAGLLSQGCNPGMVSMQGIGYKETIQYLQGNIARAQAIESIQQNTRHYAKRQMTWFRNQNPDAVVIRVNGKSPGDIAREIKMYY